MRQIEYNPEAVRLRRRTQAGQSAVVAIITLFLLLFIAAIFISIIAGNLKNTKVASNVSAAGRYAEAGINYLDQQLTNSPEGADWRPVPDSPFGIGLGDANYRGADSSDPDYPYLRPCGVDYTNDGKVDANDEPCGFSRVNFGSDVGGTPVTAAQAGGRALVRVTYQPGAIDPRTGQPDPLSRYIKLESVGRVGQILPNDPTTYSNTEGLSQRVELVAYKAIGLNEYVRNITNKDNKPGPIALGAPFPIRDRGQIYSIESLYQGAVHVNGPLTFYGVNRFILDPYRNEALEVSGPILLNNINETTTTLTPNDSTRVYISAVNFNGGNAITPASLGPNPPAGTPSIFPSNSPNFTTLGPELSNLSTGQVAGYALVRDNLKGGENQNLPASTDNYGNPYQNLRVVPRQSPPVIDNTIGQNGLTRYRALTRDSAPLKPSDVSDNPIDSTVIGSNTAGLYGWGQGLYINNSGDIQAPSINPLGGGYSLRSDWLNPLAFRNSAISYWNKGDSLYTPPGVVITLHPRYFTVESGILNAKNLFRNPSGTVIPGPIIRYTPLKTGNTVPIGNPGAKVFEGYPAQLDADGIPNSGDENYYSGDFVIYAEGNIRIKGVVGGLDPDTLKYFKRHLTIVSNGTIYIDGNLLRDNIPANATDPTAQQVRGQSTIALLARDYVTVNTTQFFTATDAEQYHGEQTNDQPPFTLPLNSNDMLMVATAGFAPIFDPANGFIIPPYLTDTAAGVQSPTLMMRHEADGKSGDTATIAALLNDPGTQKSYLDFNNTSYTGTVSPTAVTFTALFGFTNDVFMLPRSGLNAGNRFTEPDRLNIFLDNSPIAYALSRAAVAPSDIRIEALMYAQEGSFFVIPGPWLNPDPNDTFEQFFLRGAALPRPNNGGGYRYGEDPASGRARTNPLYPFYGEPMDVRITLCGTINENMPADIGDQGAWMEKWGWIPQNYGSTGLLAAANYPPQGNAIATMHGPNSPYALLKSGNVANGNKTAANGIIFQFDDRAIAPYAPTYSSQAGRPLRANPYNPNQPLPFAPRLPVAPGLLYYGQNTVR